MNVPWLVLLFSAACEAVWATALGQSEGFTQRGPTLVFFAGLALSMGGLAFAVRQIPIGTAYAAWTGTGASLTVTWAMVTGTETASVLKVIFIVGIIGATLGLRFTEDT